jgi:lipid A disaccharide synthetase
MERAGQHRTVRAEDVAHMGITEVLRHAPYIYRQYRKLVAVIQRQRPDIAVLIDFPDVNFRLAKHLARAGVPVVWFVSPQLWAWKRSRLRWVQQRVSKMLVIFPFEERFYRDRGVDAEFVGHPLAHAAQQHTAAAAAQQKVLDDIHRVVEAAKRPGHAPQKAVIGDVNPWIVDAARERGHDLQGYHHVMDGSAVRHTMKKHGDAAAEGKRGQVAITEDDFVRVPDIVASPDSVILGSRNHIGRDQVISIKRMLDGSTIYVAEIRRRKRELATVSMWKYPATMDVNRLEAAPHHYVRDDNGTNLIVVRNPLRGKTISGSNELQSVQEPQALFTREQYAAQHHLDPTRTWIALLPGSRWKEIRANLPALHELAMSDLTGTAAALTTFDAAGLHPPTDPAAHTRYEFLLPVASTIDAAELRQYIATLNAQHLKYFGPEAASLRLTLVPDAREALAQARASVVASGTATVLAAVVGSPFVVVYRVTPLTFALAKKLVKYPEEFPRMLDADGNLPVAMVNLIAGRRIVPELLQDRFTAANVANALGPLLAEGDAREAQIAALAEVRERLLATASTSSSPIDHVAEAILDLLAERTAA